MKKWFKIYDNDYNVVAYLHLSVNDFYDTDFFDDNMQYNEICKHNRVTKILTNSAIESYNINSPFYYMSYMDDKDVMVARVALLHNKDYYLKMAQKYDNLVKKFDKFENIFLND